MQQIFLNYSFTLRTRVYEQVDRNLYWFFYLEFIQIFKLK